MTRPGSRKPENGKQREGKKAGSLQRMPDAREIAADILMEVLEKKQYSHVVLLNALKKYQYLEKAGALLYQESGRRDAGAADE